MALKSFADVEAALKRRDEARKEQAEKLWAAIQELVEGRISALESRCAELESRVSGLESAPPPESADLGPLTQRVQALEDGEAPALAAHIEHADPHGDRAYADQQIAAHGG